MEVKLVASTAFVGSGNSQAWNRNINLGTITCSDPLTNCAMAQVSLPMGATVLTVGGHPTDTSVGSNAEIVLYRDTPGVSGPSGMASVTTSGSSGEQTITDVTIINPVIANGTAAYSAFVCISTSISAYDVVINYTY